MSVTASRIDLLGLQGNEGKTNMDGYTEKPGLGALGSLMKEPQHPRIQPVHYTVEQGEGVITHR